jgi:hypothetical protein
LLIGRFSGQSTGTTKQPREQLSRAMLLKAFIGALAGKKAPKDCVLQQ